MNHIKNYIKKMWIFYILSIVAFVFVFLFAFAILFSASFGLAMVVILILLAIALSIAGFSYVALIASRVEKLGLKLSNIWILSFISWTIPIVGLIVLIFATIQTNEVINSKTTETINIEE
ncbi:hypothetical protein [[Mycoplasma] collis]|uniref:hypothetical protein n=1 Tax=[Mycoplasma] collis TaxID=2127 RepID=UPI00051BF069|nr:hypothetical protein [[Mycoplasma] collis]